MLNLTVLFIWILSMHPYSSAGAEHIGFHRPGMTADEGAGKSTCRGRTPPKPATEPPGSSSMEEVRISIAMSHALIATRWMRVDTSGLLVSMESPDGSNPPYPRHTMMTRNRVADSDAYRSIGRARFESGNDFLYIISGTDNVRGGRRG